MCTDALPEGDRAAGEGQQGVAQTAHPAGTAHWQTTSHEGAFTNFQVGWASVQGASFQGLVFRGLVFRELVFGGLAFRG